MADRTVKKRLGRKEGAKQCKTEGDEVITPEREGRQKKKT